MVVGIQARSRTAIKGIPQFRGGSGAKNWTCVISVDSGNRGFPLPLLEVDQTLHP